MATARRAQFFEKSLKLIHHKGFKGTTMRDIAGELKCDVANLYNFVSSKHDILEQALFGINKEFQSGIDSIIDSQYSPIAKLRLIIQMYVRLTFEKPYEISLLSNGWRHLSDTKKAEFLTQRSAFECKVKQVIEEGIAQGEMKAFDIDLAISLILSSVRWLFDHCTDDKDSFNPVEVERQINEFVISGISI